MNNVDTDVKDVVIVSKDLAVSPPSPRRRPIAPGSQNNGLIQPSSFPSMTLGESPRYEVPTTPIPQATSKSSLKDQLESIDNIYGCDSPSFDNIITEDETMASPSTAGFVTRRFRKSSSTGDSRTKFKMSWRPQKSKKARRYREFPLRMLKVYDLRGNTCVFHSSIAHDTIEREWPEASFSISGYTSTNAASFEIRFELWAARVRNKKREMLLIGNAFSNLKSLICGGEGYRLTVRKPERHHHGTDSQGSWDAWSHCETAGIDLVVKYWTLERANVMSPSGDSLQMTRSLAETSLNRSSSVPVPRRSKTSTAARSKSRKGGFFRRVFGSSAEERMKDLDNTSPSSKEEDYSSRHKSFESDMSSSTNDSHSTDRSPQKNSFSSSSFNNTFMNSPRRGRIDVTHFESLETFQKKLQDCKTRFEFCSRLARSQRLISRDVPLVVPSLSTSDALMKDLKRQSVRVNDTKFSMHVKSANKRMAFLDFTNLLGEHITKYRQEKASKRLSIMSPPLSSDGGSPYIPTPSPSPASKAINQKRRSRLLSPDLDTEPTLKSKHSSPTPKNNAFHRRMSLRAISYKRRVSESKPDPRTTLQVSWICQNLAENRIGQSVYNSLCKLLGIDLMKNRNYNLYDMKSQNKTDVTANVRIDDECITIERLSEYEIEQASHLHGFNIPVHVKTTSRFFINDEEENIRIELLFDPSVHNDDKEEDEKKKKKKPQKKKCDWFDQAKLNSDVSLTLLTLHSKISTVPKVEILERHNESLGIHGLRKRTSPLCLSPLGLEIHNTA